ncbi:MAG: CRISPR-associated protein Cas4 [Labilibaculum antarcticum]
MHYYFNCHRQLWLFANGINMEHTSDDVFEGKMIHETSYQQRSSKYEEIAIDGIKIDYYDTKNKVVHEIKKSSKLFNSHAWQVKYYIYVLELNGIEGVSGILEYPKEHKTEEVFLSIPDKERIAELLEEIDTIIHTDKCPETINLPKCKKCSYYDFCYSSESEE